MIQRLPVPLALCATLLMTLAALAQADTEAVRIDTPPTIDGLMREGEWADVPKVEIKTALFPLSQIDAAIQGVAESEALECEAYFANDSENLYIALVIKDVTFNGTIDMAMGVVDTDVCWIDFDSDGIPGPSIGDDRKAVMPTDTGLYLDQHRVKETGDEDHADDAQVDGEARMMHSTGEGKGDYTLEFRIPLNSGDADDLAAEPGDAIGLNSLFIDGFNSADPKKVNLAILAGPKLGDMAMGGSQFVKLALAK